MAAKRASDAPSGSAAAWRVPRLPTDEEFAAMGTGGEKEKSLHLAMIRGEIGITSANSADLMAGILGGATPRDSATVGYPPSVSHASSAAAPQPQPEGPVTINARYWQLQARLVIEYGDMVSKIYGHFGQDTDEGRRQKNLAIMARIKQIISEGREAATALKTQFHVDEIGKVFEVLNKLHAEQSRDDGMLLGSGGQQPPIGPPPSPPIPPLPSPQQPAPPSAAAAPPRPGTVRLDIEVPEGANVGDRLTFNTAAGQFTLVVPSGAAPGKNMVVTMPVPANFASNQQLAISSLRINGNLPAPKHMHEQLATSKAHLATISLLY